MRDNWKTGKSKGSVFKNEPENAIMVGVIIKSQSKDLVGEHLDELEFLAMTAGAVVKKKFIQKLDHPDVRNFVRKGKLEEIAEYVENNDISMVLFDDDLSGKQTLNLEEKLKVKIIDRSTLILDIFATRAQSSQAKTQVELAQMQYLLPRLRGLWTHLERQRGGIGMRGPGEQEIETDRRIVRDKISLLKTKLEKIDRQNITQRKNRGQLIRVALVGYTNVGKSTLMNTLSKSELFAENKLFATLDTTVRKVVFETMPFLLSDTVGFIRKLPHHLVESFKSTLDEVRESDLLIHIVDVAHPQYEDQINTVQKTLQEMGASEKPILMVLNKIDLYRKRYFDTYLDDAIKKELEEELVNRVHNNFGHETLLISATKKINLNKLRAKIKILVAELYERRYPYQTKKW